MNASALPRHENDDDLPAPGESGPQPSQTTSLGTIAAVAPMPRSVTPASSASISASADIRGNASPNNQPIGLPAGLGPEAQADRVMPASCQSNAAARSIANKLRYKPQHRIDWGQAMAANTSRYRAMRITAAVALAVSGSTGLANAASADDGRTEFQITPYVWMSGFGGTIRPFPTAPTFRVSSSFSELAEDLDGAFFIAGYMRRGSFVAMVDWSRTDSSKDGVVPTPLPQAPLVPVEGTLRQTSMTVTAGARTVETPAWNVDLMAGLRAFWIRASLASSALGVQRSPSVSLVDPIVAIRVNGRLSDRWSLLGYADFGGFGVGSRFTGQVLATANYRVSDRFWLSAGWRHLTVDYRGSVTRVDAQLGGPLIGLTYTF